MGNCNNCNSCGIDGTKLIRLLERINKIDWENLPRKIKVAIENPDLISLDAIEGIVSKIEDIEIYYPMVQEENADILEDDDLYILLDEYINLKYTEEARNRRDEIESIFRKNKAEIVSSDDMSWFVRWET